MDEMSYGMFVKNRRIRLGLSQKDIADVLNCTVQAISRHENGKVHISLALVGGFCHVLKLDLSSFFLKEDSTLMETEPVLFDRQTFASNLVSLRRERDVTLDDVSFFTSISVSRLTKFESCLSLPSLEEFVLLSDFYHLDYGSFYRGTPLRRKAFIEAVPKADTKQRDSFRYRFAGYRKSILFGIATSLVAIVTVFLSMFCFSFVSTPERDDGYSELTTEVSTLSSFDEAGISLSDSFNQEMDHPTFSFEAPSGLEIGKDFILEISDLDVFPNVEEDAPVANDGHRIHVTLTSRRDDLNLTYRLFGLTSSKEILPYMYHEDICYLCEGKTLIKVCQVEYAKVDVISNSEVEPQMTFFNLKTRKEESRDKIMDHTLFLPKIYNPLSNPIQASFFMPGSDDAYMSERILSGECVTYEQAIYSIKGFRIIID